MTTVDWTTLFSDSPPRRELVVSRQAARHALPAAAGDRLPRRRDPRLPGRAVRRQPRALPARAHAQAPTASTTSTACRSRFARCRPTWSPASRTSSPRVRCTRRCAPACRSRACSRRSRSAAASSATAASSTTCPVDVVRQMGADVVIAVNIGTPLMSREQLSSIVGLTGQMINILTEQNVRAAARSAAPGRRADLARPGRAHGDRLQAGGRSSSTRRRGRRTRAARRSSRRSRCPRRHMPRTRPRGRSIADTPPPVHRVRPGRGHRNTRTRRRSTPTLDVHARRAARRRRLWTSASRASTAPASTSASTTALVEDGAGTGLVVNVREKSIGPNYRSLRPRLSRPTSRARARFRCWRAHRRVWVNSLGARVDRTRSSWAASPAPRRSSISRSTSATTCSSSAYGSVESAPALHLRRRRSAWPSTACRPTPPASTSACPSAIPARSASGRRTRSTRAARPSRSPDSTRRAQTDAGVRAARALGQPRQRLLPAPRRCARRSTSFYGQRTQRARRGSRRRSATSSARGDLVRQCRRPASPRTASSTSRVRAGALSRDDPALVEPVPARRLSQSLGPAHGPARRQLRRASAASSTITGSRTIPLHRRRASTSAARVEAGNAWQQRDSMCRTGDLVKAGSVFVAADTFLGPFYFAYGRATGGASSFYLTWAPLTGLIQQRRLARAQPRRGLASVHADEGARDAAARARSRAAHGAWLYDFDGRRYLDAVSSWWVNLFGHAQPAHQRRARARSSTSSST